MCGIAGYYVKKPGDAALPSQEELEKFVDALLLGIESRGRDATGIVSVRSKHPHLEKADLKASEFIKWRKPLVENPRMVLVHTRLGTKGAAENLLNDHPVQYETVFATHNGHISNDDELFEKHKLNRIAEVDTEIIPALFHKYGLDKAHLALQELAGNYAVAVCDPERAPDTLVLAKGSSSPLEYIELDEAIIWASTRSTIEDAWEVLFGKKPKWNSFKSLGYGEMLYIENGTVELMKFEVHHRPYQNTQYENHSRGQHRQGSSQSSGAWTPGGDRSRGDDWEKPHLREMDVYCKCTHQKFWHYSAEMNEDCLKADCECQKFIFAWDEKQKQLPQITDANRQYVIYEGGEESTWIICAGCGKGARHDEMSEMFGHLLCIDCDVEADDDDELEQGDIDWTWGDDITVAATAKELGLLPSYVGWLLFECEEKKFDEETTLVSAYIMADETYQKILAQQIKDGTVRAASEEEDEETDDDGIPVGIDVPSLIASADTEIVSASQLPPTGTTESFWANLGSEDAAGSECGVKVFDQEAEPV